MLHNNQFHRRLLVVPMLIIATIVLVSCQRQLSLQVSPQPVSLQQFLLQTDVVNIQQYGLDQNGDRILGSGIATLHNTKNNKMFLLLKASNHFHKNHLHKPADFVISMSVKNYTYEEQYDYIVDTGELGKGNNWCYVPNGFKLWVKTLPKPKHDEFQVKVINGVTVVTTRK